jgi:hypothetical protein
MDFTHMIDGFISLAQTNLLLFLAATALIILLFYKNPKLGMTVVLVALVLAGVLYLISNLSTAGGTNKSKLGTVNPVDE